MDEILDRVARYLKEIECPRKGITVSDASILAVPSADGTAITVGDLRALLAEAVTRGELVEALQELRDNIGVASLVRNPLGKEIRDKVDALLTKATRP